MRADEVRFPVFFFSVVVFLQASLSKVFVQCGIGAAGVELRVSVRLEGEKEKARVRLC